MESTGQDFAPDPDQHGWHLGIEPTTGLGITVGPAFWPDDRNYSAYLFRTAFTVILAADLLLEDLHLHTTFLDM